MILLAAVHADNRFTVINILAVAFSTSSTSLNRFTLMALSAHAWNGFNIRYLHCHYLVLQLCNLCARVRKSECVCS